jgi:hypothetical protein
LGFSVLLRKSAAWSSGKCWGVRGTEETSVNQ